MRLQVSTRLAIFAVLAVVIAYLVTVLRDLRQMGPDQLP